MSSQVSRATPRGAVIENGPVYFLTSYVCCPLKGMLSHKVVAVRPQALALAAEIVSWCGQPMLASVISELRPAQQSELDSLVKEKAEQSPGPRVPSVYLRKDR